MMELFPLLRSVISISVLLSVCYVLPLLSHEKKTLLSANGRWVRWSHLRIHSLAWFDLYGIDEVAVGYIRGHNGHLVVSHCCQSHVWCS